MNEDSDANESKQGRKSDENGVEPSDVVESNMPELVIALVDMARDDAHRHRLCVGQNTDEQMQELVNEDAYDQGNALCVGPRSGMRWARMERLEPGTDEKDRDEVEDDVSVHLEYEAHIT